MKYLSFFKAVVLLLVITSCSPDDSSENSRNPVSFSKYVVNSTTTSTNGGSTFQNITTGNLLDNKRFSETIETFIGGVSQGTATTVQHYFYNNDGTLKSIVFFDLYSNTDNRKDLFYDAQQNLIGVNWKYLNEDQYYRFIHTTSNIVYFEKITLPYNDPNAEILYRIIVEFDQNDNIIKAGSDSNLDGVTENANQFFYTNNNLTSIQKSDGTIVSYNYSNVINNFNVIDNNTYGKKTLNLIGSEHYRIIMPYAYDAVLNENQYNSNNLLSHDLLDGTFDVLPNNYYKKKTITQNYPSSAESITGTIEFFFN